MYEYIKGEIISKNSPYVVVENNGIGYKCLTNDKSLNALPSVGEIAKVYVKLIHKEDTMMLCGFSNKEDKVIFDILTSVSGIGTKVALALLGEFATTEFISAVITGDFKLISRTKGVGPKLAQKIILELKDKLINSDTSLNLINTDINTSASTVSNETILEVQTILQSLGWSLTEYKSAVELAIKLIKTDDSEELLKESLKILSNG